MIRLSDEVKDVLQRSQIAEDRVVLPPGQLDRKLYQAVNKVLDAFGGKWNRKAGAHLFKSDPREKLFDAIESGRAVHEQQQYQSFYTPASLAYDLVHWAEVEPHHMCLEPSAGEGAIAQMLYNTLDTGRVVVCEIREECHQALKDIGCMVFGSDFMQADMQPIFDRVVMNPPFTKGQDIDHILRAYNLLKPGGILVSVAALGWTFRNDKKHTVFREFVEWHGEWESIESGTFAASGTNVETTKIKLLK